MLTAETEVITRPKGFLCMDLLRAYACLMIVTFHAHSIAGNMLLADGIKIWPAPIWWYSTVDLFFVMSGFLMVHMSRQLYGTPSGTKVFIAKRAARTPLLYWLYTLLIAALLLLGAGTSHTAEHVTIWRLAASISFWPVEGGPIIPLGWTLNYEVFFYALFALSIPFAFPRGSVALCYVLGAFVLLGAFYDFQYFPLDFWTDPILIDFIFGVLLGVAYHKGVALSPPGRIALALCAILPLLLVATPFQHGDISRPYTFGLSAAFLVAAACLRDQEYTFGKAGTLVAQIGNSAYSLYLTHIITLKALELIFRKSVFLTSFKGGAYILIATICSVMVGYIAYLILEKPLTAKLRQRIPNA